MRLSKFKFLTGLVLAAGLTISASAAEVVVRIGPPRAVVEHRPPAPGRGYVWQPGYQNWNGNSHQWVAGRWEQPPHGHSHWDKPHWVKRNGGYVLVEGRWR